MCWYVCLCVYVCLRRYLRALNLAYGRAHGDTLIRAVEKEFSGWLAEGLRAMVTDHDTYYAKLLYKVSYRSHTLHANT